MYFLKEFPMSKKIMLFSIIFMINLVIYCSNAEKGFHNNEKGISQEVENLLNQGAIVIDVRTKEEYDIKHYKNALNIPYDVIENHLKELEQYKEKPIILYCRSGRRSGIAKQILEKYGFKRVINAVNLDSFPKNTLEP
jgi:phage shock protein E